MAPRGPLAVCSVCGLQKNLVFVHSPGAGTKPYTFTVNQHIALWAQGREV